MKRRKIDQYAISPRRPYLDKTDVIVCTSFARQIQQFCDEYLRAAIKLTITEYPCMEAIRASTERIGYMLRLMVEYGGEDSVLETKLTINTAFTFDTYFPNGLPKMEYVSVIAAAAHDAGFSVEIRGKRIIARMSTFPSPFAKLYAKTDTTIIRQLMSIFFAPEHFA